MKPATVFGVATQLGAPVAVRSAAGRITGGYAIDDYELELETSDIDLDHDGEAVGQIIYAELGRGQAAARTARLRPLVCEGGRLSRREVRRT